jgi:hypothetical protein
LNKRVLSINVPKPQKLTLRDLPPVPPIVYRSAFMEKATLKILKLRADRVKIGGEMVDYYINNNLNAVLLRDAAHFSEFLLRAELIIADPKADGLIMEPPMPVRPADVIPASSKGVRRDTFGDRGGLHGGEARFGNVLHVLGDRVERPAKGVEDRPARDFVVRALNGIGQIGQLITPASRYYQKQKH